MCSKILKIILLFLVVKVCECSNNGDSVKVTEDGRSSLVFVFDTTGSMYNDLEQLREGAEMILSTALDEGVIGDFVFVPFHDPAVGPATVTQDKDVFKRALAKVRVYGGGDCPEKSLGGIQMALDVSASRSYVYVFTDATAGDHRLVGKVLDAVQRKQSQVVFVLTGHCNDLDKPSFKVYQQIAAASSGQVFNLNKTSVHKVLDFVKSSIKGKMVNLGSSVNPAGSNYTQGIPVDSTLGEVTVSVSGANPRITVVDPSGELLTGPPKLITTLDLAEIMVVKVMQPEPGNWTISVASEELYSVKVAGLSNLTFEHGFSVQKPRALDETSYRPLKGTYNHMMLSLTQRVPPVTIDYAEVLTLTGSTLFELPLTEVGSDTYLAEAFIPPEEFFYIAINGRDEHDQPLRRIGATAIQAKVPDVPYLTTPRKVTVHAHSRAVLECKVESLVPLVAGWIRGARKLQPQISSLQTTTIEYAIEDAKEENAGTYTCFAQNAAGESRVLTEVALLVDPPLVSNEPANMTLDTGDNVTITCTVLSEALLLKFKFVSITTGAKVTDIMVAPNIQGVYSFSHTIDNVREEDVGTYSCIAANKGGSANQTTTIALQPKPTAKITIASPLYLSLHSVAQLSCQVDHCDTVRWVHNGVMKETIVYGSYIDVLDVNVTNEGVWACEGIRGSLKASDSIQILFLVEKPKVSIKSERDITILNGTVFKLECEIESIPVPIVSWFRLVGGAKQEFKNHTLSPPNSNYKYISTLTINSSDTNVAGAVLCVARNLEGTGHAAVNVSVRREMTVVEGFQDTSQELFSPVNLHCHIHSYPPANITWRHNNTILQSNGNRQITDNNSTLTIKRMDFNDLGTYACEASNGFEDFEIKGTLSVRGLEMPVLIKDYIKIIAYKKKTTLIPCRVLKGNPTPTITWYFKSASADTFTALPLNRDLTLEDPTLQDEGVYRCVAENVVGTDTYDVEVVIHYPPQLKSPEGSHNVTSVAAGTALAFSCEATGVPPPVVLWTRDHLPIPYSKNVHLIDHSLVIDKVTAFDSGRYTCNATNPVGSVHKNFALMVYETPKIASEEPSKVPVEVLEGQLVELPCEATGVPKPTLTWSHNGLGLDGDRIHMDEFGIRFVANLTDFGNFTCFAKNEYGNSSITYTVYVWVPPSIEPPLKTSAEVLAGSDVSLQCDVIGFPVPTVQWVVKEELLKENTTDIRFNNVGKLHITNASSHHAGTYVCVAENFVGIANKFILLNIYEPPKILEDNYTGPYLATNLDSALIIACAVTGKPRPYVVWTKDEVYLHKDSQFEVNEDGSLTLKSPTEDMSGNYTCTAKNKVGSVSKTVPVEIYSLPTRTQSEASQNKATVLEHTNATLQCAVRVKRGDSVKWYKDAQLVSTDVLQLFDVTRANQATYACLVTNAVGSAYSTVNVDVEWPPKFIHSYNDDDVDAGDEKYHIDDEKHRVNDDKYYLKDDYTKDRDGLNENIVKNDVFKKTIENGDEIDNHDKENDKKRKEVVKKHQQEIKIVRNNDRNKDIKIEIVKGEDLFLDCETDAKPFSKVKWLHNSYPVLFEDKHRLKLLNVQPHNAGTYKCTASNQHGTVHRRFAVNVLVPPYISPFDLFDVSLMEGDNATLDCIAKGNPEPTIQWTYDNTNWHLSNFTLSATNISKQSEGLYRCDAANKAGRARIVYRVTVLSPAHIQEIVVFSNREGTTVDDTIEATLGTQIRISCKSSGHPTPSVQWLKQGEVLNTSPQDVTPSTQDVTTSTQNVLTPTTQKAFTPSVQNAFTPSTQKALTPSAQNAFTPSTQTVLTPSTQTVFTPSVQNAFTPSTQTVLTPRTQKILSMGTEAANYADLHLLVDKAHAGQYTCVAVNEPASDTRTVTLQVLEAPRIFKSMYHEDPSLEVLSGQPFYLHCHPLGTPLPQVYWFKDGLPLKLFDESMVSMEFGEVLFSRSAREDQSGNYTCVARNSVGNTSAVYLVSVLVPPPQPKESAKPVSVPVGRPLELTCPVEGTPVPHVMWVKHPYTEISPNHRVMLLDYNVTMFINRTLVSDSGNYSCIMVNKVGSIEMVFSVTITKRPSIAGDGDSEEHVVPLRRSVVLKCEADGHPLPTIIWLKDTQKLSNASSNVHLVLGNSLLALWSVTSRDAAQYICVVDNAQGTALRRYNVHVQVPGKWSTWGGWSLCNTTCGFGQQGRTRVCQYIDEHDYVIDKTNKPDKIVLDESACKGPSHDRRTCQMPPCEQDGSGEWLPWSKWSPCSVSCGRGTQARTRKCTDSACEGDNVQIRKCPELPKCSSNEKNSENDVYSPEDSKEDSYLPEAVFEKQPEITNSLYLAEVEHTYVAPGVTPANPFYSVNVISNLDGSDAGTCRPGFKLDAGGACQDIDECEFKLNQCHSTQICENIEGAYRCSCQPGYVSLGLGQRCMDINECSRGTARCEFACVNTAGGYVCACPAHMRLHTDKHHCFTVSSYRKSYEELDTSEYLSASIEHPARYKHIRNV